MSRSCHKLLDSGRHIRLMVQVLKKVGRYYQNQTVLTVDCEGHPETEKYVAVHPTSGLLLVQHLLIGGGLV